MPTLRHQCGLLKNAWYAGLLSGQLGSGSAVQRTILGELLVFFRDESGRANALIDRCPHRNALLSAGRVHQGRIQCPYHGWTFDGSGRCTHIPSEGPGEPQHCRVTEAFPVCESDGLVWVWLGGTEPARGAPFQMPYYAAPHFSSYYMETVFDNSVTNLVENFMDVPHTVFVHRGWFRSEARKQVPITVERTADSVCITYHNPNDSIGWSEKLLNPKGLPLCHTDQFFMPNVTQVDYTYGQGERAFVITSTCTPISERQTRVFTLISFNLGRANPLGRLLLPWYTRKVIQQDVEIMAIQQRALDHYKRTDFHSSPADAPHLYIESLRSWAEAGGTGPKPGPARTELSIWI